MVVERDFYQVLGVGRGAASEEIRAAYIRLVKRHHPDMVGHLPARLHDVQQAYRCLSDTKARAEHDRALDDHARHHLARQRAARRRLRRYDRRYPDGLRHVARAGWRRIGWRSLLVAGSAAAIVAHLSLRLIS